MSNKINEILASDGVEGAGGPARKDGKAVEAAGDKGPVTVNSPAAPSMQRILDDQLQAARERFPLSTDAAAYCPSCLNPIKSEAAR